jgi:hypothetical protein
MTLSYVIVCLVCSMKNQVKVTLVMTLILGVCMLMIVIGGAVYVIKDMKSSEFERHGNACELLMYQCRSGCR